MNTETEKIITEKLTEMKNFAELIDMEHKEIIYKNSIEAELNRIQKTLKAPKSNTNNFGKYKYRSCEDILEAVKPILGNCILTLSDEVASFGTRFYVVANAKLSLLGENITTTAYARESETKKGMDEAQITGAATSYARKMALGGLFCIDNTADADTRDNTHEEHEKESEGVPFYPEQNLKADITKMSKMELVIEFKNLFITHKIKLEGDMKVMYDRAAEYPETKLIELINKIKTKYEVK